MSVLIRTALRVRVTRDTSVIGEHMSRESLAIGSAAEADIRLHGLQWQHARLSNSGGRVVVEPFASDVIVTEPIATITRVDLGPYTLFVEPIPAHAVPPRPGQLAEYVDDGTTTGEIPIVAGRYEATEPVEADLVERLRAHPADELAREVYADWLEHNGFNLRASFLRTEAIAGESLERLKELAVVHDVAWRALTSRPPIECDEDDCPGRWSELRSTSDDLVRRCERCNSNVYYCSSLPEARRRAGRPIAIDAALDRGHVLRSRMI